MLSVLAAALVPAAPPPPLFIQPRPLVIQTPVGITDKLPPAEWFNRAVKPVARQPIGRLISSDDYPADARRNGREGMVELALSIGEDGRVTSCALARSSGVLSLDVTTCNLVVRRARYTPARDGRGLVVPSATSVKVERALPPRPRIPVTPWHSTATYVIGADNHISGCTEERSPGAPAFFNSCDKVGTRRAAQLLARRERKQGQDVTIQSIARMIPAEAVASVEIGNREPLGVLAADLEIGADGSLVSCKMVRAVAPGPAISEPNCRKVFRGPFSVTTQVSSGAPLPVKARMELLLVRVR